MIDMKSHWRINEHMRYPENNLWLHNVKGNHERQSLVHNKEVDNGSVQNTLQDITIRSAKRVGE